MLSVLVDGKEREEKKSKKRKKKLSDAGFEPAILCSVGRCLIHWASRNGIRVRERNTLLAFGDCYAMLKKCVYKATTFEVRGLD